MFKLKPVRPFSLEWFGWGLVSTIVLYGIVALVKPRRDEA